MPKTDKDRNETQLDGERLWDLFCEAYSAQQSPIGKAMLEQKFLEGIVFWADLKVEDATNIVSKDTPVIVGNELVKTKILQQILDALCSLTMGDGLTGLFNRRYFDHQIVYELQRGHREYMPCSVVLADIDHFKQVNDEYGHDVGDLALQQIAKVFVDTLRQTDVVTRYGGEEFAILLPGTGIREAVRAAERMRAAVENTPIRTNGHKVEITISAGVSTFFPPMVLSPEQLMKQADQALYQAKKDGRNRVKEFGKLPPPSLGVSAAEKEELF
ncbi:MAG: GGDEF domain-containing protein [Pseudomonadota bacterium]